MNQHGILHIQDSSYAFALNTNCIVLRLRVDKKDAIDKVEVVYECKYKINMEQQSCEMERKYEDAAFAYYEIMLPLSDVRFAYVFRLWEKGRSYYFSEDGLSGEYDFKLAYFNFFQMPYINKADIHQEAEWMKSAVFYEIFIERFCRGIEDKDDSYINLEWGSIPNPKSFTGGDIPGITQNLDYIKNLGANALYLTPIFKSISNHKYDISDYYMVDAHFGTNEDFKELVKEAHRRGIRIVLDAVFNHCSDELPQFQDVVEKGKNSEYYDWFIIDGDKPVKELLNYEVFASCDYMPKFNTSNPKVQEFLCNIAVFWIEKYDIDGWRLDVSDEVSHDFWRVFRKRVKSAKEDAVIIGENWHDANTFLKGDQYDSIMNYAFTKACLDYYAFETFSAEQFAWKLNHLLMRNTLQVNRMMLNLLDTHDTDRFYTSVHKNEDRVLSAVAVMCMFLGAPCVYYGTELKLEGGYDPDNRRCFDWNQKNWDMRFMGILKSLLQLKKEQTIQSGDICIDAVDDVFCLCRYLGGEEIILYANQSKLPKALRSFESDGREILVSNKYEAGTLDHDGFLIIRNKR